MKKSVKFVVIIFSIIICAFGLYLIKGRIEKYNQVVEQISALENPIDIADKYMKPQYNYLWKGIEGIDTAKQDTEFSNEYVYELIIWKMNKGYHRYNIWTSAENGICCETMTGTPGASINSKYFYHGNNIGSIFCSVDVYDEGKGYWEEAYFDIFYEDGEYVAYVYEDGEYITADVKDLENIMNLTINEIVEIAENDQKRLENILYKMKERMLAVEKIRLILEFALLSVLLILIVYRGCLRNGWKRTEADAG